MSDTETAQPSNLEIEASTTAKHRNTNDTEKLIESIAVQVRAGMLTAQPGMIVIDMTNLARAEGMFIKAQTRFLLQRNEYGTQEYLSELGAYSRAQTELIDAFQVAMHQAGLI